MDSLDLFSLRDKVAIVTGAGGLLGKQHCYALAGAGATVIAADLHKTDCDEFIDFYGRNHLSIEMDVCDRSALLTIRDTIMARYGSIDILVNNAAINDKFEDPLLAGEQSKFENYPLEMWNKSLEVNITGVFLCSQIFGSVMAEQGGGSIINIASTYGVVAPDQKIYRDEMGEQQFYKSPAYPVTKSAVIGLTRYLAAYWGERNVRVNALSPGGVENNQDAFFLQNYAARTLLNRMADKTDYMGALVFLASEASGYMTGANLVVDGGWTTI